MLKVPASVFAARGVMALLAVAVFGMIGCHANPYSDVQGNLDTKPPEHKPNPQVSNFYVQVEPKTDVAEGATSAIKVVAVVPTGSPILRYDNLPSFCAPDAAGTTLKCSPTFGDAYDPKTPNETTRSYVINIFLSSTDAPSATIPAENMTLIVHHVSRGMSLNNFDTSARIDEGTNYQSIFQVVSADYPNGPFTVATSSLPVGVKVGSAGDATHFILTYSPAFTTVTVNNKSGYCSGRMCINLPWNLTVLNPRGEAVTLQAFWNVVDVRQMPVVVTPSPVTATFPNADFYVQVEDPNGEVAPQVSAVQSVGTIGVTIAATSPGTAVNNPYTMVHTQWTGNPATSKGTTQTMNLKSCVYSDVGILNQCVTSPVNVQF